LADGQSFLLRGTVAFTAKGATVTVRIRTSGQRVGDGSGFLAREAASEPLTLAPAPDLVERALTGVSSR
jgi:hypothetical protein